MQGSFKRQVFTWLSSASGPSKDPFVIALFKASCWLIVIPSSSCPEVSRFSKFTVHLACAFFSPSLALIGHCVLQDLVFHLPLYNLTELGSLT
jgi:hypothetical protein